MTPEEERLAALTNKEMVEELAMVELPELLGAEIGLPLGVEGMNGIRATAVPDARTGEQAVRLRRFMSPWELERREAAYTEHTPGTEEVMPERTPNKASPPCPRSGASCPRARDGPSSPLGTPRASATARGAN